jgi:HEAT repeat protein
MGLLSWLFGKKEETKPAGNESVTESEGDESDTAPGVPVEELEKALLARDGGQRVDGARALIERWRQGDAQAASALAPRIGDLLQDSEPLVRLAGLSAARLLRKPENLEKIASHVLALLADGSAQVRTAAVWSAVRLPGEVARVQARAVLRSDEEPMRFAAACALAEQKDPACLQGLTAAIHEDVRRQEALSSLMALGDPAAVPAIAELFADEGMQEYDRVLVAAALARFGDARGAEHLVACITESGDVRPIAAEWAGRLGVTSAIEALTALSEEAGDPARGAALRALGRLKAPGAEKRLLELAGSRDTASDLRMDAAEGLAELGTAEAQALLEKLGREEQGELGPLCRELLLEMAAAAAITALEKEQAAAAEAAAAAAASGAAGTTDGATPPAAASPPAAATPPSAAVPEQKA